MIEDPIQIDGKKIEEIWNVHIYKANRKRKEKTKIKKRNNAKRLMPINTTNKQAAGVYKSKEQMQQLCRLLEAFEQKI